MWDLGHKIVVGVDEVGRGAWAGPISVGAAVVPKDTRVYKIRDSKMLTETEREALFDRIAEWCVAWSVGHASHSECDRLGMSAAQRLAVLFGVSEASVGLYSPLALPLGLELGGFIFLATGLSPRGEKSDSKPKRTRKKAKAKSQRKSTEPTRLAA